MNYSCIWFHFFSAAGLILDTIFLHSRKLWLCLDFPTFPFSTELAGFIKKVRNKNKTSLSGLSIDEIVQRVTEHILDEERKKKVSVSFKFIIYSTFFLFIYKMIVILSVRMYAWKCYFWILPSLCKYTLTSVNANLDGNNSTKTIA